MIGHPLAELLNHEVERARERDVKAPDRVDVSPATGTSILEVLFDVLESQVDLAGEVLFVNVALSVPSTLARTLDDIADTDGLGVGVKFVVCCADAFIVEVFEGGHSGWMDLMRC